MAGGERELDQISKAGFVSGNIGNQRKGKKYIISLSLPNFYQGVLLNEEHTRSQRKGDSGKYSYPE